MHGNYFAADVDVNARGLALDYTKFNTYIVECTARTAQVPLRLVTSGRAIELKILCNMEHAAHVQFSLCQKSLDLITEFTVARVVPTIYNRISDDRTSPSLRPRIWNFGN